MSAKRGADRIPHPGAGNLLAAFAPDVTGADTVRKHLAEDGLIIAVWTIEAVSGRFVSGPDIVSRRFVYVRESEDLLEEAHNVVADAVADCLDRHVSAWGKIKNIFKDSLSDFLWKRMKRNPMILPIIMEV